MAPSCPWNWLISLPPTTSQTLTALAGPFAANSLPFGEKARVGELSAAIRTNLPLLK